MSASLNQLSVSSERPLDPVTLDTFERVERLLRGAGIAYMLVGATARDLLLFHVYGHAVMRATYDLDFAVLVESWEQFHLVKQLLASAPGFIDRGRQAQRLHYQPPGTAIETVIDVLPFGELATAQHTIEWPPRADVVMNVAAFAEVFANRVEVRLGPDLSIPEASLPGLLILKLFAWNDRRDDRDVADIRRLIETYADAGNIDRLYEQELDELEQSGFDLALAGAYLLGKDARLLTDETTRAQLSATMTAGAVDRLVYKLARAKSVFEDHTERAAELVNSLLRGLGITPAA